MRSYIVGLVIATGAMGVAAQQSVSFASPPDSFKLNSTATGMVIKNWPFLKVRIDQHVMWQPKQYDEPTEVIGFRVGLAGINEKGQWDSLRSSALVSYAHTIKAGDTQQIPASTVLIPVDGVKSFEGKWLVMTMVLKHRDGTATTYAHSGKLKLDSAP